MTTVKRWLPWVIGLFLFVVVMIAALPGIILRTPLRRWIADDLLAREGVEADIGDVRAGWFQATTVLNASLGPLGKRRLLEVDQVQSDRTLWSAIFQGVDVGDLSIIHPRIHIWIDKQGSNLAFAARQEQPETLPGSDDVSPPRLRTLNLRVSDAELWLKTATMPDATAVFLGVDLQGALQRGPDGRALNIEPGKILDHSPVSPQLCDGVLKFVLPILSEATWVRGEISVELDECHIHLDEPAKSSISGQLHIHGIEAGIKNELAAMASDKIKAMLRKPGIETVYLAENSIVKFQIRDGTVWHEGVEIGLPKVSEDLVVRTHGSVSFQEELDLTIEVPIPLHLVANGPLAQALTDKSLTLHAGGTLQEPNIVLADESPLADVLSSVGARLAGEDQPLRSLLKGFQDALGGDSAARGDPAETPLLDGLRNRRRERNGPLRRLLRGRAGQDEAVQVPE